MIPADVQQKPYQSLRHHDSEISALALFDPKGLHEKNRKTLLHRLPTIGARWNGHTEDEAIWLAAQCRQDADLAQTAFGALLEEYHTCRPRKVETTLSLLYLVFSSQPDLQHGFMDQVRGLDNRDLPRTDALQYILAAFPMNPKFAGDIIRGGVTGALVSELAEHGAGLLVSRKVGKGSSESDAAEESERFVQTKNRMSAFSVDSGKADSTGAVLAQCLSKLARLDKSGTEGILANITHYLNDEVRLSADPAYCGEAELLNRRYYALGEGYAALAEHIPDPVGFFSRFLLRSRTVNSDNQPRLAKYAGYIIYRVIGGDSAREDRFLEAYDKELVKELSTSKRQQMLEVIVSAAGYGVGTAERFAKYCTETLVDPKYASTDGLASACLKVLRHKKIGPQVLKRFLNSASCKSLETSIESGSVELMPVAQRRSAFELYSAIGAMNPSRTGAEYVATDLFVHTSSPFADTRTSAVDALRDFASARPDAFVEMLAQYFRRASQCTEHQVESALNITRSLYASGKVEDGALVELILAGSEEEHSSSRAGEPLRFEQLVEGLRAIRDGA